MKTITIIPFFCLLIMASACTSKTDCTKLKKGFFTYGQEVNSDTKIYREGNTQTEWSEKEGFKDEYYIEWTSECAYFLVLKNTNKPTLDYKISSSDTMFVDISKVKGDKIDFSARINDEVFNGRMIKLPQ